MISFRVEFEVTGAFTRPARHQTTDFVHVRSPNMFTGLIEALGTVQRVEVEGAGRRLVVGAPSLTPEMAIGDSLAVNGACLTVVERSGDQLHFQAGPETLQRTNLGELKPGDLVNLERPLAVTDRLDGHFVQALGEGERHPELTRMLPHPSM